MNRLKQDKHDLRVGWVDAGMEGGLLESTSMRL